MDMQGKPIGNTPTGVKVIHTTPADPIQEGPGGITSDSLAADSARRGGAFSSEQPLGVSGSASTLNNTDTSGATTLEPSRDAESRSDKLGGAAGARSGAKYAEGVGGQGEFSGVHDQHGYVGGPTGARSAQQTTSSGSDNSDSAPSHAGDVTQANVGGRKPKGANITEGGIDDSMPNASFGGDIGTDDDPGRAALGNFQRKDAESGLDAGGAPRQKGVSGFEKGYGTLSSEENA
ncbi:MAG: hypothetical protein Q9160_006613 [Pyrenula sp. 1 TL-2023]